MADSRRRGRRTGSGRQDVLPSILDSEESAALPPPYQRETTQNLLRSNSELENSMTYTQLERDIKGDSENLDMFATMEREKYGTEVEVVNTLQEYFAEVDPRAPKHFINACLNLVESKGPEAVDGFLKAKYGVSPFSRNFERDEIISISTDKNKILNYRTLISDKISESRNIDELKPLISELYSIREDLQFQDERIVIDAICSWTYRYGIYFLSGKLEIFYLGSVESEDQTMVEVLRTLPEVPFHDQLARKTFLEKHKVELSSKKHKKVSEISQVPNALEPIVIASDRFLNKKKSRNAVTKPAPINKEISVTTAYKPAKETMVYVDDDINLDKDEIAFLWINVHKFYQENNYAKGQNIELIKQTENSVYYILQHGIEGFNTKIADKFGRKFMNLVFILPQQVDTPENVLRRVNELYSKTNDAIKNEAKGKGKRPSKRSFNKLIEALNFKFTNAQKQNKKKEKKSVGLFQNLHKRARNTEMSFRRLAGKGKGKTKQPERLLEKKIKLFILQSMKTPITKVDSETKVLLDLHRKKGSRAFKTRLKIAYGGQFDQVDFMSEEEIDATIERIMSKKPQSEQQQGHQDQNTENSAQFVNIYKELTFHRNPETQLRYNRF